MTVKRWHFCSKFCLSSSAIDFPCTSCRSSIHFYFPGLSFLGRSWRMTFWSTTFRICRARSVWNHLSTQRAVTRKRFCSFGKFFPMEKVGKIVTGASNNVLIGNSTEEDQERRRIWLGTVARCVKRSGISRKDDSVLTRIPQYLTDQLQWAITGKNNKFMTLWVSYFSI